MNPSDDYPQIRRFIEIVQILRGPNGCPWDKKQTHDSLKPFLIEETYEVLEAIDSGDKSHLKEELGDLLLQIVLHAQLADDAKDFNIEDVAHSICEKMIRRHPHVFAKAQVKDADEVVTNWEDIKKQERLEKGQKTESILQSITQNAPALFESHKISKKAAKTGFEWKKPIDVFDKMTEELNELKVEIKNNNPKNIEEELGDLLFTATNLCRVYKVNPEIALKKTNRKFRQRFIQMEIQANEQGLNLEDLTFEQWNEFWNQAKTSLS